MDGKTDFVTRLDLVESQQALHIDVTRKIDAVDDKVDNLRDMVLPMLEATKQTAVNTREISDTLKIFTGEQRTTNGKISERLNTHDISLTELGVQTRTQTEVKRANATIIVAVITVVGILVGGMFGLAPYLFK